MKQEIKTNTFIIRLKEEKIQTASVLRVDFVIVYIVKNDIEFMPFYQ